MDAIEQVKNSGKSSKKSANAEVVTNSNDKGLVCTVIIIIIIVIYFLWSAIYNDLSLIHI